MYLLDANILITAHDHYYGIEQVPQFWEWLRQQGEAGHIKIPPEIFEEIKDGGDDENVDLLYGWITTDANKAALLLAEEADPQLVQNVIEQGYAPDLTDDEIEILGRDPFLIACALADPAHRIVVTNEASKPSAKKQNRKVPDVCKSMGVQCVGPFVMTKALGFKT